MRKWSHFFSIISFLLFFLMGSSFQAHALDLDWSGQFRSEFNSVFNYTLGQNGDVNGFNQARFQQDGYYIPGGGEGVATFQTLFFELRPKVIVNDNIFIKSELWLADPIFGMFGSGTPNTIDRRYFNSTFSSGSAISANRMWLELQSDLGTVMIGRMPLHYGLGVVWNNGDGMWDRYQSTGDSIKLVSKFGAFTFSPSVTTYTMGPNVSGSCDYGSGTTSPSCEGKAGISDYSILFQYDSPEQDFQAGLNFIRRLGGSSPGSLGFLGPIPSTTNVTTPADYFAYTGTASGMNYNTFDFYLSRKFGRITLSAELPLVSGSIGGVSYQTWALATETKWEMSDSWQMLLKAGRAPGQNGSLTTSPDKYTLFGFHPAYRLGMIMFNYQLANFVGPNNATINSASQLRSPYDNPILNAHYLYWNGSYNIEKWNFDLGFVIATAMNSARSGEFFYNTNRKKMSRVVSTGNQESFMGWEVDTGITYRWDDNLIFRWDMGLYFPGSYYQFSNVTGSPNDNQTSALFATAARVGVSF